MRMSLTMPRIGSIAEIYDMRGAYICIASKIM